MSKDQFKNVLAIGGGFLILKELVKKFGDKCPRATKSVKLNTLNRQKCIEDYQYGPPNPALPNEQYWYDYAKKWLKGKEPTANEIEQFKTMRCWNCSAFDISPRMMKCLPPVDENDNYDLQGLSTNTVFGYCWMHHFKCRSERTCYTWAGGGPIKTDETSMKWTEKYG